MPKLEKTGRHEVTVKSSQYGESDTGTPFFNLSFETDAGEYIGGWLYLSEAAFAISLKTLRDAFGFNGDFETLSAQVDGKRCAIVVESETYQGKDRLKVKFINAVRAPVKPIAGQGDFLKKLSAQAARTPAEAPRAKAPTKAAAPAPDPF